MNGYNFNMNKLFLFIHRLEYKLFDFRAFYYSKILGECGANLKFWGVVYIKNPGKLFVGDHVSINDGAYINALGSIEIGNNVSISAGAKLVSTMLDVEVFAIKKQHINRKIVIGSNVQVGAGAIILPGIIVGDNVIIGAGSVVTKDIASNCVVVGNPAKKLREL
jgi:maltose O-acetyltransferase